ncbi:MAG: 3-isopropylmalate dehydratase large subunit [Ectothiorhodospiraceae bacterium]|nr:3-isopropylmalate dehydratase large subunit [Chromatiales bacterium]MCP5154680.1 3-isopropylmalate dehydratase large subunit [Ectothiorhodospiraceae bacterium]
MSAAPGPRLLVDKIWERHVVRALGQGYDLLYVTRHMVHELSSDVAFAALAKTGRPVRRPDLTFATEDHVVSTAPDRGDDSVPDKAHYLRWLRDYTARSGITSFPLGDRRQGIVHVVAPEQGIALPGTLLVCGDSHTCTVGGLGAIAWGIGTSEVAHVLATQTLVKRRPRTMRVTFEGRPGPGTSAKDLILRLIGHVGAAGGDGHAVEYAGAAIRALDVEGRLTLCNLSIELGARIGTVAPDDVTFDYLAGRPFAPKGAAWDAAVADWRTLPSDPDARADREVTLDVTDLAPQVTWGTSPAMVTDVQGTVPDPSHEADPIRRAAAERALEYMALEPGTRLADVPVDVVFVGSCTNSRLSDLRAAARVARGRRVAPGVRALVVPGSGEVRRAAEAEGLDRAFLEAGFEWRAPGCSMCVSANDDRVGPGKRCVSTSNRNFESRQGPGARTHLASPATAAASAITGRIADPRSFLENA